MESLENRLTRMLGTGESFDMLKKNFAAENGDRLALFFVNGFIDESVVERVIEALMKRKSAAECRTSVPCADTEIESDERKLCLAVLSGKLVLCGDFADAVIIDARSYPARSVEEPENDKVLRGPRDGFGEKLLTNTILIRRRIRDTRLIFSSFNVGAITKTDVAVCYMKGIADPDFVAGIKKKIGSIGVEALNMGHESIAECLVPHGWFNPFPKIRYTERPDAAAAMLLEGSVMILCDNSPQCMILPTSIFDFLQASDDFYMPPVTGTYLRLVRLLVFLGALILSPTWYLLISYPDRLPEWLRFILVSEPASVPVIVQLFLAEFMIDGLKLASLNTPSMLSNSLSIVGGLILGDFAVTVGWFCPEVILYMALVSIATFTQQSYELGYAFKFLRLLSLCATALFGIWGYVGSIAVSLVLVATNRGISGKGYLYPLIPFDGKALYHVFFRPKLRSEEFVSHKGAGRGHRMK